MASSKKTSIEKSKLLVVEGDDAYYFSIWACQAFQVDDVQVMNFGGITDLRKYLETLKLTPGYDRVNCIVIARDAECDPESAVSSVKSSLLNASFSVPEEPFQFSGNSPRVAFMIFPGYQKVGDAKAALIPGTLEDLCLEIVRDYSTLGCVDSYINCLETNGFRITHLHKTKLHAYLAGMNDFVGLKLGEASRAGAWDWNHNRFENFRSIITQM